MFHHFKDPVMIVEGKMQYLYDERGRRYLDVTPSPHLLYRSLQLLSFILQSSPLSCNPAFLPSPLCPPAFLSFLLSIHSRLIRFVHMLPCNPSASV